MIWDSCNSSFQLFSKRTQPFRIARSRSQMTDGETGQLFVSAPLRLNCETKPMPRLWRFLYSRARKQIRTQGTCLIIFTKRTHALGARTAMSARTNVGKQLRTARLAGNEPNWPRPPAMDIRAQDSLTWTRGQSCPRSNDGGNYQTNPFPNSCPRWAFVIHCPICGTKPFFGEAK